MNKKIFVVKFTFCSNEKDVRILKFTSPSALQGSLVTMASNVDVELLDIDVIVCYE